MRKIRVLLVEDNPGDARLIRELLSDVQCMRFAVDTVGSLSSASCLLMSEPFDVVLLDLSLPDSRGIETLTRILDLNRQLPIVVLTGLNDQDTAVKAVKIGAQDYLVKGEITGDLLGRSMIYAIDRYEFLRQKHAYIQQLESAELRYRTLFNSANDIICCHGIGPDGMPSKFVEVNEVACSLLGYSRDELLNRRLQDISLAHGSPSLTSIMDRLVNEKRHTFEAVLRARDGRSIPVEVSSHLVEMDGSQLVLSIARDMSERKRAEEALKASEEKYRRIVETAREGIWLLDTQGYARYSNGRLLDLLGVSEDRLRTSSVFSFVDPFHQEQAFELFDGWLKGMCEPAELCLVRGDGRRIWALMSTAPVLDHEGAVTGILAMVTDVTERREAEEQVRYMGFHDKLTDVYNRAYLEAELERLEAERQVPVSVIMGDLNGLKLVNDTMGHAAGDALLTTIARIISDCCRKDDVVVRWGGDEFVIVLPHTNYHTAEAICERIRRACRAAESTPIAPSIALGAASRDSLDQPMDKVIRTAEERMYKNKLLESTSTRSHLIASLRVTLTERTKETDEHCARLRSLALSLAQAAGLSESQLDDVALLALLHDLGKVGIPDSILTKACPLTEDEWAIMRTHPEIGYRIAQGSSELSSVAEGILCHHERWDGKGYPRGLSGERIPIVSRIVAIADAYDVMLHDRPYRPALSHEEALLELVRGSGTQFDPRLIDLFIKDVSRVDRG